MNKARIQNFIRSINKLFLSLDENSISWEMNYRRIFPKGPKLEIPDSSTVFLPELETEPLPTLAPLPYLQAVQNDLKQLEDLPTAKLADFEVPQPKISLPELDEAAKNLQMPEK